MPEPARPPGPEPVRPARVQEEKLVALKDDTTAPPPTIGTPSWMGILGGPALGQPASRFETYAHGGRPARLLARAWLLLLLGGFLLWILVRSLAP